MSKRKTHKEYVAEVAKINPNIEVIGQYINCDTKILHRCKIDGYEWYAKPNNILNGKGCPKCGGTMKKTHEEYVEELSKINPDIEVLEKYINVKTPILHLCKRHNIKWKMSPTNALQGHGCCECLKEKIGDKNRKTHEQYVTELRELNQNIIVLGTYIDSKTPILHKCLIDGYEWMGIPSNILFGQGCPKCARNIKRTHDEYVLEVSLINSDIEVIGQYINARTPILHNCKKHNLMWNIAPYDVLLGRSCRECGYEKIGNKCRKTNEQYIEELLIKNSNLRVIEEYIDNSTPILHKCLTHNVEWMIAPSNALLGCGCPECRGEKIGNKLRKTHTQYVEELKLINPNIEVVSEYVGVDIPIWHRCLIDGYEWKTVPRILLNGGGCPQCNETWGERQVRQWLEKYNIKYTYQMPFADCRDIKPLPFDFYLHELNICIEYDGIQHFEPIDFSGRGKEWAEKQLEYTQIHDKIKNEYCENNNIKLLRISYFENVEEELNNFLFI